jgi:hypothetical protein
MAAPDLLRTPCSCLGKNPVCFKCNGWGYLDKIGRGESLEGFDPRPRSSRPPKVLFRCPHCPSSTPFKTPEKLAAHIAKKHVSKE